MKKKQASMLEAQETLRDMLKPGTKVYCILRHVSASGMTRNISLVVKGTAGSEGVDNITHLAARAMGETPREYRGNWVIRVGGCGMDMGFHLVYNLGRYLFPNGFIPSEAGLYGRNGVPPTEVDPDGGYALRHEWL